MEEEKRVPLHFRNPAPDIHLPLHTYILEGLFSELGLPQDLGTVWYRALSWAQVEESIDARFAHLVVAFVDEELHVRVQVS